MKSLCSTAEYLRHRERRVMKQFLLFHSIFVLLAACTPVSDPISQATIETVSGTGEQGTVDGSADRALLDNPFGVIRGPDGALWFCEYTGHTVRRIDSEGNVTTVVGDGEGRFSGDGDSALQASLHRPHEIRFDDEGNLYIADMLNHAIRKVDLQLSRITTIAGTGEAGFSGDGGPANEAQLSRPHSIQFGPKGNLYVADIGNHRVRLIDMDTGIISTFAGPGKHGVSRDGERFAAADLNGPRTLDFDAEGNLWLVLRNGNQVYKLDLESGLMHHKAGTGEKGFTGNGGPAVEATLSGPKGIALASNGDAYLVDTESHTIRIIEAATGNLQLIVGTGEKGDGPDGNPLQCKLARPHGIFLDANGDVYIGDSEAHKIRRLRM